MRTKVVVVGLGPIGREIARALAGRAQAEVVGAADPAHAGADLGELVGMGRSGVAVAASAAEAYARAGGQVAILCTTSRLVSIAPQVEEALAAGYAVVSTCEELASPSRIDAALAAAIDRSARARGKVVLGTGVNPGLVMDRLPLALAQACVAVERVHVRRVVDAAKRRGPLRAKVGAGLAPDEFRAGVAAGKLGHVGLGESISLIARGLGFELESIRETVEPVVAARSGIEPGRVAGVHQVAKGLSRGEARVTLDLEMSVGAPDPHDRVQILGDPPMDVIVQGGTQGDRGTVGTVVNAIPHVVSGPPGLRTVAELPLFGILR
jgi:4-hydroxy-tetrahydrodipicolinate reductase